MEELQNGKLKVQYLLGELTAEEEQRLDEQFFVNDDYFEEVMATEDELIEDYLRNRLSAAEMDQFERKLLNSSALRRKVQITRLLLKYVKAAPAATVRQAATLPKERQIHRIVGAPDTSPLRYENSFEAHDFLSQGLQTYQTCLSACAISRFLIIGLLWAFLYLRLFTNSVEAMNIFLVFSTVAIPTYVLLEVLSLRRSVEAAKLAIYNYGRSEMTQ